MTIPVNIKELIDQKVVESNRVEFKESFNPAAIIRTICAFANDIDNIGGGYIVIGVKEKNGHPVYPLKGVDINDIDNILKKLREKCHYIEPLYEPVVEPVLVDDVYVIVIWVQGGYGRPYKTAKDVTIKGSNKYYYIRKFSSSVIASSDEEKELFYVSSTIPFDDRPNLLAEVDDLDLGLMREHLKQINSSLYERSRDLDTITLAKDMQLIGGPPERLKPLNVGLLMFSENIEKYFRYARIEIVDIPDPTGTNMVEKVFKGPIQRQLKDALAYINNYVIKQLTIKVDGQAEALRFYNYPYEAIEEILSNAVYHRSYQINEPITVRINKECMEITSFPGFGRSISDKDIQKGEIRSRIYRNRRIGDFLKELKLIEGRNTNFPNAQKALIENGSGELKFVMDEDRNFLSVVIPVHDKFIDKKEDSYGNKIVDILKQEELSLTELAIKMGYKGISAKLRDSINNLIRQKRVFYCLDDNNKKKLKA